MPKRGPDTGIRQRPNGKWEASLYHNGTRYYAGGFEKKSDAKSWRKAREAEAVMGLLKPQGVVESQEIVFDDAVTAFLAWGAPDWQGEEGEGSHRYYSQNLGIWSAKFGDRILSSITGPEIQAIIREKVSEEKSRRTVQIYIQVLGRLFRWAKMSDRRYVDVNPIETVEIRLPKRGASKKKRHLTIPELKEFLQACEPDIRLLMRFAAFTGLRLKEISRAQWDWVNFEDKTLTVKIGKTGEEWIPLADSLVRDLRQEFWDRGRKAGYIFTTAGEDAYQRKAINRARKSANLKVSVGYHMLRHTLATHLYLLSGKNAVLAGRMLRHAKSGMSMTFAYLHQDGEDVRPVLNQYVTEVEGCNVTRLEVRA